VILAFSVATALLLGAVIAWAAACTGGRQRDGASMPHWMGAHGPEVPNEAKSREQMGGGGRQASKQRCPNNVARTRAVPKAGSAENDYSI